MKYLIAFLCACNFLSAKPTQEHVTYTCTGTDDELYFNITLAKGLEFSDCAFLQSDDGKGQGCEVVCVPSKPGSFSLADGYQIQEIRFTVCLKNGDNPNQVATTTTTENVYSKTVDKCHYVTKTVNSSQKFSLKNPAIDLTQEPDFFPANDEGNKGVIVFKNSFPYSQIK